MNLTPALRREYETLFASARVTNPDAVKWAADRVQRNWARYEAVSKATGVPAFVIACLHCLEASFDFGSHLHNGDPLTRRTVQVPANRPKAPPANGHAYTWEESAADALAYDGAQNVERWDVAGTLHFFEQFNGWGYRPPYRGQNTVPPQRSPYLWSFTNHYQRGKYIRDGEWSSSAVSAQVGCCALLIAMQGRVPFTFEGSPVNQPTLPIPMPPATAKPYEPADLPIPPDVLEAAPYSLGMQSEGVRWLIRALMGLGFLGKDDNSTDVYNQNVEAAVRWAQAVLRCLVDGVAGEETLQALGMALKRVRKQDPKAPGGKPVRARFAMKLVQSSALRVGALEFFDAEGTLVRKESATSGLPGFQTRAHLWTRARGPIPNTREFTLRCSEGYHLDTRGIEGWAFPIAPDPIHGPNGGIRSEIMLHRDANVPGTAGCIGFIGGLDAYEDFVAWAKPLGNLPLEIVYT